MLTGIIIGLLAGILAGILIAFFVAPALMFRDDRFAGDFEDATQKLEAAVEKAGWKTPAVHDLQATLKKFGKDVRRVNVYAVCNPDHAYEILSRDKERMVSNMMPCRIAVYEKSDGSVWISRMNSGLMSRPMSPVIRKTMSAAAADVESIIDEVLAQ